MKTVIFLLAILFAPSNAMAGDISYRIDFEIYEGEDLISTSGIDVESGQHGSIHLGDDDGSFLLLKLLIEPMRGDTVLVAIKATYYGDAYSPDLLVELGEEACLSVGKIAFKITVREVGAIDAKQATGAVT